MVRVKHIGRSLEQASRTIIAPKLRCFAFGEAWNGCEDGSGCGGTGCIFRSLTLLVEAAEFAGIELEGRGGGRFCLTENLSDALLPAGRRNGAGSGKGHD